jgi:hypothetical protein
VELQHTKLLHAHEMPHLDFHQITTSKRIITQTIAADAFDRLNAAAIRFPSRQNGSACYAIFETRGHLEPNGKPIALTDPAPTPLKTVAGYWKLKLEPTPAT